MAMYGMKIKLRPFSLYNTSSCAVGDAVRAGETIYDLGLTVPTDRIWLFRHSLPNFGTVQFATSFKDREADMPLIDIEHTFYLRLRHVIKAHARVRSMLKTLVAYIVENFSDMVWDACATHIIRSLALTLAGYIQPSTSSNKKKKKRQQQQNAAASGRDTALTLPAHKLEKSVPSYCSKLLAKLCGCLSGSDTADDESQQQQQLCELCEHPSSSVTIQLLVTVGSPDESVFKQILGDSDSIRHLMQSGPGSRSLEVFISRCSSEQPEVFHSGVMGFVKLLTEEDMTSLYEGGFGLYVLQAILADAKRSEEESSVVGYCTDRAGGRLIESFIDDSNSPIPQGQRMQFIRALVKHEGLIEKLATQPSAGSWVLAKMWESSIADAALRKTMAERLVKIEEDIKEKNMVLWKRLGLHEFKVANEEWEEKMQKQSQARELFDDILNLDTSTAGVERSHKKRKVNEQSDDDEEEEDQEAAEKSKTTKEEKDTADLTDALALLGKKRKTGRSKAPKKKKSRRQE
ncbi:hypothetical protein Pmar_PMAR006543 [Perkinsus marinus ATCC 50983]|uniref:Nucleolar protein 9 n=1 Tax=Perkinsus marinus (strain ATCC 50983 / TXsc) TaxID=423536 RepID=C5LTQ9_PERM5|nr:hypothetical protein Pmar_PMAR006543 [Perkinsus marinus ATCC 50983]EEQ99871.1 hypothetical protein Pmar_PMAR006543 [Perkinsus marinus ATCC 50983]|eukprot:XP_002767154.1 hypothetical protein Pmar_PMAR006543 [Perkinsus marinus ATCC 50983]